MLQIWLCSDRKKNTQRLLEEIAVRAGQGIGNQFLIVPEQFSHTTERKLCKHCGDKISRYAEVLGFSRLATRVFSEVGGIAQTETDPAGRLLAMSLAVEQVRSRLKIYASCADKPEFLLQMLDTFDELQSFCITSDRLRAVQRELTGVLAVKMEEIALLMDCLAAVYTNMGQNPQTRLTRLLGALEESGFAKGKRFYFDGFTDFNGVEREILAQLLCDGAEVIVCLHCDALEHGGQQFERARHTGKALLRAAQEQSVEVKTETVSADAVHTPITQLRSMLFYGRLREQPQEQEVVQFVHGADRVTECRAAVGEMLRLVQGGMRWRDISVACADLTGYRPILESLFRRAEVPAYYAGDADILCHPVVRMLLSALEAASDRMDRETVLAYLKSGFLPISRDRCDRLENYIFIWSIDGDRWEKPWTMHPLGVDREFNSQSEMELHQINADRTAVLEPLLKLRKALRNAQKTAEMVTALDEFCERIGLRKTLSAFAESYSEAGELQKAQEYAQVYEVLSRLMEQLYGIMGESVRKPEEFYRIFRTALSRCSIGTIPAQLDCVTVGSLMSQRRCDTKAVFLLGANEGSFPSAQENRTLLTDRERSHLLRLGIELAPTAAGQLAHELSAIDSVLNAPSERLYIGAVQGQESYFFTRATKIFPKAVWLREDEPLILRAKREYLAYLVGGAATSDTELQGTAEHLKQAAAYAPQALSADTVSELYGKTLKLSSTKIENLAACQFRYFLQYGLRAKERRTAEVDSRIYGVFVHEVLEKTAKQVQDEGGFSKVSLARVLELAEGYMLQFEREHPDILESPRSHYLFRRNFDEVRMIVKDLYDELSVSQFAPKWFELNFSSSGGSLPAVKIEGEHMRAELEGTVDRVDLWHSEDRTFARVIDYKTGKKGFEYTNVYHGLSLQMLLYLFALIKQEKQTELHPAGVLYFPARIESLTEPDHTDQAKIESDRKKQRKRSGLLLNSWPVLQAMEPCDGEPTYLPYCYDKENTRVGDLASEEQFRTLDRYVYDKVVALGEQLYSGEIAPNPYFFDLDSKNACKWCPYQTVCNGKREERWLEKIKSEKDFWQRLEASDG